MTKDFYQELAEYLHRNVEIVTRRCQIAYVELAWLWDKFKTDPIEYYRETDLYIYDLTFYMSILQEQGFYEWFKKVLKDFQIKSILDYGGGCGEIAILACQANIKTDYLEIEESQTLEYAKYRFKKYNVNPKIFGLKDEIGTYDLIIIMDVLEHIENNVPVIEELAKKCTYLVCNVPEEIPYNFLYPQHISTVNLSQHFVQVAGRLWKSKDT